MFVVLKLPSSYDYHELASSKFPSLAFILVSVDTFPLYHMAFFTSLSLSLIIFLVVGYDLVTVFANFS